MNYRHAFHAGNFADVLKHAVLVRILLHLGTKPTSFRVIDTHAGAGRYDLAGPEASRAGEWRDGIARLLAASISRPARDLLAPYLDAVKAINGTRALHVYPGSPLLAACFLRAQDRLVACELEQTQAAALGRTLAGNRRSKALTIDGWVALKAYIPPKERRGLVLVDPSFEEPDDFARLTRALEAAHSKWPSGIYLAWYPIKEPARPAALIDGLRRARISRVLCAELRVARHCEPRQINPSHRGERAGRRANARSANSGHDAPARSALSGCGLIVINPPFTLAGELAILLPELATIFSDARRGGHRVEVITT